MRLDVKKLLSLAEKHRAIILYLIFGVLTTVINWVVYVASMRVFTGAYANVISSLIAWIVAVLFAYVTNRRLVFESRARGFAPVMRECAAFFASRVLTGVLDLSIMYVFADVLRFDGKIVKLVSNIIVVVLNYILSKIVVFKKTAK